MYIGPWQEYHMNRGRGPGLGHQGVGSSSTLSSTQLAERDKLIANIQSTLAACLDPAAAALALKNINPLLEANSAVAANINARRPQLVAEPKRRGGAPLPYPKLQLDGGYWEGQAPPPLSARLPEGRRAPLSGRTSFSEPIVGARVGLHAKHPPPNNYSPGADSDSSQGQGRGRFQTQYSRFMTSGEISQQSSVAGGASVSSRGSAQGSAGGHAFSSRGAPSLSPSPAAARKAGGYSSESVARLLQQDRAYRQKQQREAEKAAQLQVLEASIMRSGKGPGYAQHWGWSEGREEEKKTAPVDKQVARVKKMQTMYMQHLAVAEDEDGCREETPQLQPQPPPASTVTLNLAGKARSTRTGRTVAPASGGSSVAPSALADEFGLSAAEFQAVSKYFEARETDRADLSTADALQLQLQQQQQQVELSPAHSEVLAHRVVSPPPVSVPDFSLPGDGAGRAGGSKSPLDLPGGARARARAALPVTNYSYARALELDERRLRAMGDPCSRSGSPRHGGDDDGSPVAGGGSVASVASYSTAGGGRLGLSPGSPLSASRAGSSVRSQRANDSLDLTPSPLKGRGRSSGGALTGFNDSRTSTAGGGADTLDSLLRWSSTLSDNIDDW